MKVSKPTNDQLDYWVAKAQGWTNNGSPIWFDKDDNFMGDENYRPTISWIQCGELIEKYRLHLNPSPHGWIAIARGKHYLADTPHRAWLV